MRLALFALVLIPSIALAGEREPVAPASSSAKPCTLPAHEYALLYSPLLRPGHYRNGPTSSRLDRQPAADLYLGVMHIADGCEKPIKIRQGIGGGRDGAAEPAQISSTSRP